MKWDKNQDESNTKRKKPHGMDAKGSIAWFPSKKFQAGTGLKKMANNILQLTSEFAKKECQLNQ